MNAFSAPIGLNISVRWSGGTNGLRAMVTPVDCVTKSSQNNCSDFAIVMAGDYAWSRTGRTSVACKAQDCSMTLNPTALQKHTVTIMLANGDVAAAAVNVSGFKEFPNSEVRPLPRRDSGLFVRLINKSSTIFLSTNQETKQQIDQARYPVPREAGAGAERQTRRWFHAAGRVRRSPRSRHPRWLSDWWCTSAVPVSFPRLRGR